MQHGDHALLAGAPDRLDIGPHLGIEAGERQEDLDAVAAGRAQRGNLVQHPRRRLTQDRMQEVVGDGLSPRDVSFPFQPVQGQLAGSKEAHIAQRGDAAGQRSGGAAGEIVDPVRLAGLAGRDGQVHVRIHAAGQHELARGVDLLRCPHLTADLGDPAAGDADIGLHQRACLYDLSATYHKVQSGHVPPSFRFATAPSTRRRS